MNKRIRLCVLPFIALTLLSAGCTQKEENMNTDEEVIPFDVELIYEHDSVTAKWQVPEGMEEYTQELTAYDETDQSEERTELFRIQTEDSFIRLSDRLAWYCQQAGTDTDQDPIRLSIEVSLYHDEKTAALGKSESVLLTDFFPSQYGPVIEEELPPDDITGFSWQSQGMSMDSNFSFFIEKEGEDMVLYGGGYYEDALDEDGRILSETEWNALLNLFRDTVIERKQISDPELIALDESEETFQIEWSGMRECERNYYILTMAEATADKIRETILSFTEK